jgi:hypothetical protein
MSIDSKKGPLAKFWTSSDIASPTQIGEFMDDDLHFEGLPENPEAAFVYLVHRFRAKFEEATVDSDNGDAVAFHKMTYLNEVIAAAKALDIPGVQNYEIPENENHIWDFARIVERDVEQLIVQIKINQSRDRHTYSVALSAAEKAKARHYVEKIKELVDAADCLAEKKDAIYKKLNELLTEIDRYRTRFEVVTEKIRTLARLSGEVERAGAEPWWRWVRLFFGVVDAAKEDESSRPLPKPTERKRLESPRKSLPTPSNSFDDEVPF